MTFQQSLNKSSFVHPFTYDMAAERAAELGGDFAVAVSHRFRHDADFHGVL